MLLASAWLASLLLSDSGAFRIDAAPYRSPQHGDGRRHQRGQNGPKNRGSQRPASRFVGSSAPKINALDEDETSSTYFERNGLSPPPLISRRRLSGPHAERRAQRFSIVNAFGAAAAAAVAENDTREEGEEDLTSEPRTELEAIVEKAKFGEDDNSLLRYDLIFLHNGLDRYYYDKHSYPWDCIWYNQTGGKLSGLPVEMNINFSRVFSVDIVNSVMDLVVWLRLVWVDPRLTWDPEEYGNITKTWFWIGDGGAGGETSEIWTPDIKLWNLDDGLMGSFEDSYAQVSHDGTVVWGRPGHLKPTCKFVGLDAFPFDKLTCTMEFGSWVHSGKYLSMEMYEGVGHSMGNSLTSGESYEEYSFAEEEPITCQKYIYPSTNPLLGEDWPVLLYNVTVMRSWQPYARGYIATQVILNFVGFCAFWLPPSCGERMGLSITAMLAALAADIVIAANLPMASEYTWFSKFSILSTIFAFVSLVESVMVLYFYYKRSEDLVPHWYTWGKDWFLVRKAKKRGEEIKEAVTESANDAVDALQNATGTIIEGVRDAKRFRESILGNCLAEFDKNKGDCLHDKSSNDEDEQYQTNRIYNDIYDDVKDSARESERDTATVKFADHLIGESGNMPRRSILLKDFKDRYGNSITTAIQAAPKNADDFQNEEELHNNMKWKHVASRIDDVARFWIPLIFVVALAISFAEVF